MIKIMINMIKLVIKTMIRFVIMTMIKFVIKTMIKIVIKNMIKLVIKIMIEMKIKDEDFHFFGAHEPVIATIAELVTTIATVGENNFNYNLHHFHYIYH